MTNIKSPILQICFALAASYAYRPFQKTLFLHYRTTHLNETFYDGFAVGNNTGHEMCLANICNFAVFRITFAVASRRVWI